MIVKLNKNTASTEGIEGMGGYIFYYPEDRFSIYHDRRKKVKFLGIKHDKDLDFLGTLKLRIWVDWDGLNWNKKQ